MMNVLPTKTELAAPSGICFMSLHPPLSSYPSVTAPKEMLWCRLRREPDLDGAQRPSRRSWL